MNWPVQAGDPAAWEVLGLTPTPDQREIKRAYARLAKITRPDEDPAGFQRLRSAYDYVLERARHLETVAAAQGPLEPERAEPVESVEPATAAAAEPGAVETISQSDAAAPVADAESIETAEAVELAEPTPPIRHPSPTAYAEPAPAANATVTQWLRDLATTLENGDAEGFQAQIRQTLALPLASLPGLRTTFSHGVLDLLMRTRGVPLAVIADTAATLAWAEDATLNRAQAQWLTAQQHARLREAGINLASELSPLPTSDAMPHLQQWLAQNPLHGLEDRAWVEIGLMTGLTQQTASLELIDALAEFFGWDQDVSPLMQLSAADVQPFLGQVFANRREQQERDYEASMHQFAYGPAQKPFTRRYAQWAARAVLEPHKPWRARLWALCKPVQTHAANMLQDLDEKHPVIAAKLDPAARAFWYTRHVNYGDNPLKRIFGSSFPVLLLVMLIDANLVEWQTLPAYPLSYWGIHLGLWLFMGLAVPLLGWLFFYKAMVYPFRAAWSIDQAFTHKVATHLPWLKINPEETLIGWRTLIALIGSAFFGYIALPKSETLNTVDQVSMVIGVLLPWIVLTLAIRFHRAAGKKGIQPSLWWFWPGFVFLKVIAAISHTV